MDNIRRKVILVDDIKFGLMMGKQKLQEEYEVYPALSAERMFEILENIMPDVILLDINMPGCNGFQALKKLKNDQRYASIPVILVTSRNDTKSVTDGLKLGACDLIVKPFNVDQVSERIGNVLDGDYLSDVKQADSQLHTEQAKPSILAVDDAPSALRSVQNALQNSFNVYTLSRSDKLEEFLSKTQVKPELFLLDLNMPVVSGRELLVKIREMPEYKTTPIIFLSSDGAADTIQAARDLGADDFLVKPCTTALLRETVSKHIYNEENCL